jgi:hypothetical protein
MQHLVAIAENFRCDHPARIPLHGRGNFYPLLANVGKQIFKEHAWLGYAVAHRFVQCWGLKRSRNANNDAGAVFQHETFCGLLSSHDGKEVNANTQYQQ